MSKERDKFLTEAMGYHNVLITDRGEIYASRKGETVRAFIGYVDSWELFGFRWEWAQMQAWFWRVCTMDRYNGDGGGKVMYPDLVNPARFADAIYKFLKREPPHA